MKTKSLHLEKSKLVGLNHYLIGFGLVVKGIDKLEHFEHFPLSVIFFFIAGAIIIIGTAFHHQIERFVKKFDAVFFILEGIALLLAGLILFEKHGSKIPYFLMFIAFLYLVIGSALILSNDSNRERVFIKIQKLFTVLFLAAAAVILVINILYYNSVWLYIMALLFVVSGVFMKLADRIMKKYHVTNK